MSTRTILPCFAAFALAACGAARPSAGGGPLVVMEEMRIVASGGEDDRVFESYDAGELFEAGTRALNEGHCQEAVERYYDRLAREFPTSRFVAPALYNAGLCLHEAGQLDAAAARYERVVELAPATRDGKHAAFQLAQVLLGLERWEDALELSERLLLREDLVSGERLEGLTRRAQALLGLDRLEVAERQARDALSFYRTRQGDERVEEPYFAAAANFVLAETLRMRSEAIRVPDADVLTQREVLDARARLILDAQREYFSTIRFTDAHWAAAAGYQIGSMYDRLWHAMMQAPIPPPTVVMNAATHSLYEQEYRAELSRHIRPLIRHAIRYWELTLLMVERTGVRTDWAERTRTDLERMRTLLLDEPERESDGPAGEVGSPADASSTAPELPRRLHDGATGAAPGVLAMSRDRGSSGLAQPPAVAPAGAIARDPAGSRPGTVLP